MQNYPIARHLSRKFFGEDSRKEDGEKNRIGLTGILVYDRRKGKDRF
jgi:hypothetical protein